MKVDVAIITTRADEFKAVLKRFSPNEPLNGSSSKRTYAISQVKMRNGKNCVVALVSCSEEGSDTSQKVTNDIIHDLDLQNLLLFHVMITQSLSGKIRMMHGVQLRKKFALCVKKCCHWMLIRFHLLLNLSK